MVFTYDLGTDAGMVRLLLNDTAEDTAVFQDDEVAAFLALEGGHAKLAAAQAIDTNADNEALASKVLTDHDVSTDGAKLADSLRKRAAALRAQHYAAVAPEEGGTLDDGGWFSIVAAPSSVYPPRPELT